MSLQKKKFIRKNKASDCEAFSRDSNYEFDFMLLKG